MFMNVMLQFQPGSERTAEGEVQNYKWVNGLFNSSSVDSDSMLNFHTTVFWD